MLIVLLIAAAFNYALSAAVASPIDALRVGPPPLTILGRDIPLPECVNPAGYRTVQQIILSCLATIFACTWVSLHPNVPDPRNSGWQNLTTHLRTVFWAIIGPEFVLIWAFRQRIGAARNAKKYNEKFQLTPRSRSRFQSFMDWFRRPDEGMTPDRSWGLTHGFLLEMHGLRYFQNGLPFTPSPYRSWTINSVGQILPDAYKGIIIDLSQLHERVDISEGEINDKSKGDFFTKLIVIIQTTWFIVQCVARWVQRLHVTELEIVTLAFAMLNIITYLLWWNKPLNMRIAIPIHDERNGGRMTSIGMKAAIGQCHNSNRQEIFSETGGSHPLPNQEVPANHSNPDVQLPLPNYEELLNNRFFLSHSFSLLRAALLAVPRSCWIFVCKASPLRVWPPTAGDYPDGDGFSGVRLAIYSSTDSYWESWDVGGALGLIGVLFGGVHLLPIWLSSFSMSAEKYLWMACNIGILVEPVTICLYHIIPSLKSRLPHWVWASIRFLNIQLLILGYLLYAPARLILIVLAFTNLRSLPPDTFVNVDWSDFFPHI
ncbi:hypothetical protein NP233_g2861 [Leucocoprinus birnbaumii]|uniref:Uncharacterized protein n=1 Tax=Leucocoprinus birnbaumii TaxID=56174 RepID=A0AAD5VZF1_9AGAR|nr:hypothetical protein NP233_g2861 [Leucocoprinus birnbaumii]